MFGSFLEYLSPCSCKSIDTCQGKRYDCRLNTKKCEFLSEKFYQLDANFLRVTNVEQHYLLSVSDILITVRDNFHDHHVKMSCENGDHVPDIITSITEMIISITDMMFMKIISQSDMMFYGHYYQYHGRRTWWSVSLSQTWLLDYHYHRHGYQYHGQCTTSVILVVVIMSVIRVIMSVIDKIASITITDSDTGNLVCDPVNIVRDNGNHVRDDHVR